MFPELKWRAVYDVRRSFRPALVTLALMGVVAGQSVLAHDLFIKLDSYFLQPGSQSTFKILNGTFTHSDAPVSKERVSKIVLVGSSGTEKISATELGVSGDTTFLTAKSGLPGSYVLGISVKPNLIELDGKSFNEYLESDGIPDVLAARRQNGELERSVVERYSKHVKAVYQVGGKRTRGWEQPLEFPAEIQPLSNPYELEVGEELTVRALVRGKPVANQLVIAGGDGQKGIIPERSVRTDDRGLARFEMNQAGRWYVKFIHMIRVQEEGVDYESNWATLSFEVR